MIYLVSTGIAFIFLFSSLKRGMKKIAVRFYGLLKYILLRNVVFNLFSSCWNLCCQSLPRLMLWTIVSEFVQSSSHCVHHNCIPIVTSYITVVTCVLTSFSICLLLVPSTMVAANRTVALISILAIQYLDT